MRWALIASVVLVAILLTGSCVSRSESSSGKEGVSVTAAITAQYRKISPQLAKEMMDSGESVIILDVRSEAEYEQGHIPGAVLMPNETIDTAIVRQFDDREAVILVYCRSGNRSAQAARKLVSLGYVNVYDFGGIIDWPYETVR